MTGAPIVCTNCSDTRFLAARRLQHVELADGTSGRTWATGLEDAQVIVCATCGTRYVWNAKTLVYDRQPPYVAQP